LALQGLQVVVLTFQLEGHVLDLPHGGALGRCDQRHKREWNQLVHLLSVAQKMQTGCFVIGESRFYTAESESEISDNQFVHV
jgi:hypothetical protein